MDFPFDLPSGREFDAIGFGTNAVDFLIRVPAYPEFNSKVELVDHIQAAGGEAATTMAGLQRLGLTTSYAGRFGSDPAAEIGMRSLEDEGVDLSFAECIEGARTQIAFIVIDIRNGERTVIWDRDTKLAYSVNEAPLTAVADAAVLHLTPHDTEACIAMADAARRAGTIVSIDVDRVFPGVEELLSLVDVLIASSDFPAAMTGIADNELSLRALRERFGCPITGITLGDSGSLVLGPEGLIRTPSYSVPGGCRDTTGAGDSFRVGFLYGMITGASIEEACRMANAAAALKCRAIGARTSLPTKPELLALLNNSGQNS